MDITLIKAGGSCIERDLNAVAAKCLSLRQKKTLVVLGYSRLLRNTLQRYKIERPKFVSASGIESAFTNELVLGASLISCYLQLEILRSALLELDPSLRIRTILGSDGVFHGTRKTNLKVRRGDKIFLFNDDLSGKINRIDKSFLISQFAEADLVLIGPLLRGEKQELLVCDGDAASAHLAVGLELEAYTVLSDIDGLLVHDKVIEKVPLADISQLKSNVTGGMAKKLYHIDWALRNGVKEVCLRNGANPNDCLSTRFSAQ